MEDLKDYKIYDAKEKVLGRLASSVAKEALKGNKVAIINAELALIIGDKKVTLEKYKERMDYTDKANPDHSPYWSKRPDLLVKRIVRGMLPYKRPKGKTAYRNLKVYMGIPVGFNKSNIVELKIKGPKDIYTNYMNIKELSESLGYSSV